MAVALTIDPTVAKAVNTALEGALRGDEAAARRYARAWRRLVRQVVADHDAPASAFDVLDHLALTAPFAPQGPVGALMSAAASIMTGMSTRPVRGAPSELPDALDYQRFSRVVLHELSGAGTGLERLLAAWQLSVTDAGHLFGVARQAVQQWLDGGVPPARQPKLVMVLRVADLLERNLLPERVPGVVRTPARAYGNRTLLQAIADDDHDHVFEVVARSFDWSATG